MGTVADKLGKLAQTKADIKAAIIEKGQTVEEAEPFSAYPDKIRGIETQINQAREVQVVAANEIKIGDTVYTKLESADPVIALELMPGISAYNYNHMNAAAFSPDGKLLVLGGTISGGARLYAVKGEEIAYLNDICADGEETPFSKSVNSAAFSPDGKLLVLGGAAPHCANIYSVEGTQVTYVRELFADVEEMTVKKPVNTAAFSPDGRLLALGCAGSGGVHLFTVEGTTFTYAGKVYSGSGTIHTAAFSPDGSLLMIGGDTRVRVKAYSMSGTQATLLEAGPTQTNAYSIAFSPDGALLVLDGTAAYAVSGTEFTAIENVPADKGRVTVFTPDGAYLILGGNFDGHAKIYSVEGQTITYKGDIPADDTLAALEEVVSAAAISPDGRLLILGGAIPAVQAREYVLQDGTATCRKRETAHKAESGVLPLEGGIGVGYAKSDIAAGEAGMVTVIGEVTGE